MQFIADGLAADHTNIDAASDSAEMSKDNNSNAPVHLAPEQRTSYLFCTQEHHVNIYDTYYYTTRAIDT